MEGPIILVADGAGILALLVSTFIFVRKSPVVDPLVITIGKIKIVGLTPAWGLLIFGMTLIGGFVYLSSGGLSPGLLSTTISISGRVSRSGLFLPGVVIGVVHDDHMKPVFSSDGTFSVEVPSKKGFYYIIAARTVEIKDKQGKPQNKQEYQVIRIKGDEPDQKVDIQFPFP